MNIWSVFNIWSDFDGCLMSILSVFHWYLIDIWSLKISGNKNWRFWSKCKRFFLNIKGFDQNIKGFGQNIKGFTKDFGQNIKFFAFLRFWIFAKCKNVTNAKRQKNYNNQSLFLLFCIFASKNAKNQKNYNNQSIFLLFCVFGFLRNAKM